MQSKPPLWQTAICGGLSVGKGGIRDNMLTRRFAFVLIGDYHLALLDINLPVPISCEDIPGDSKGFFSPDFHKRT